VFSGIEVSFTNPAVRVRQLLPVELPDLFNGDQLVLFGRYSGAGASAVTVAGTFGGVLTLGLIDNLLNLFNVQSYYLQIFKGLIILVAVLTRRKE